MRKAANGLGMRGSRKKQPPVNTSGSNPENAPKEEHQPRVHAAPPQVPEQPPPEQKIHHHRRRKPADTDEVGSLTSKNYRLAKELSELRVRYREECKSGTRLTMENMNLASRCREAISHVAMLKKELAMHQKRAAEALAMQREQTQRIATNLSTEMSRLSQSGSEDDGDRSGVDLERIMSPMRPPTTPRDSDRSSHRQGHSVESPRGELFSEPDEDDTVVDTVASSTSPSNETTKEEAPKVYSTPNRNRNPDRWQPKIDQKMDSPGMFPSSASPKVVEGKPQNYNEEFPPDMIANPHQPTPKSPSSSSRHQNDAEGSYSNRSTSSSASTSNSSKNSLHGRSIIGMNSIDAFEASFNTKFPAEFASKEEADRKARLEAQNSSEIYNPFSPSPARSIDGMRTAASSHGRGLGPVSPNASPIHPTLASSPTVIRTAHVSDSGVFGNPVTPEEKKSSDPLFSEHGYRTPPMEDRSSSSRASVEPKRPEKTVPVTARARYEKAMQPRTSTTASASNSKVDKKKKIAVDTKPEPSTGSGLGFLKGSPSALLKRIQQRRHSKQGKQPSPSGPSESVSDHERETPRPQHQRQKSAPDATIRTQPTSTLDTIGPSLKQVEGVQGNIPLRRDSEKSAGSSNGSERPFDEMEDTSDTSSKPVVDEQFGPTSPGGAQSIAARFNAMKNRRSVKQPVSYAEPALNTKLRRGDEFFPRDDKSSPIVTPEQISHTGPVIG